MFQRFSGRNYLLIDIANQFGLDKEPWDNRIDWSERHYYDLETMQPQAESPVLYAKAVNALREVDGGNTTNHMMGLDATASGIQIMSAMSGCTTSAKAVNLIDTGRRECLYTDVAAVMGGNRNEVKYPVMTYFYGSTAMPEKAFGDNVSKFYDALKEVCPGPRQLKILIQQHWDPEAEYYTWIMPDDHTVHIPVTETVGKNIEIDEWDHARFKYLADVPKPQAKGRALAANVVHSVDAWICRQMVLRAKRQGFDLVPIHDCFFASPNYMNHVRMNYMELLTEVAKGNWTAEILSQIKGRPIDYVKMSDDLPDLIMESNYALS